MLFFYILHMIVSLLSSWHPINSYLHQALQDTNKHDATVMDPGCWRDEHVQKGCQEDGSPKHPRDTMILLITCDANVKESVKVSGSIIKISIHI